MKERKGIFLVGVCLALVALGFPDSASACSACFGQSDAPMAQGFNTGIFSLLGVVLFVLGGVVAFFIYLARRARKVLQQEFSPEEAPALAIDKNETEKSWFADSEFLKERAQT